MEDQSLQVSSLPPIRERVGLIMVSNVAIAVKTIVYKEARWSATDMDGPTTCFARCINDVLQPQQQKRLRDAGQS